ncbi:hypothetical protein LUB14_29410, partial [Klebsiella pneumoniae]|uniref:hypothetical protein n=1 Tax=Klebsiella pneumoniae TaxID=573 RepID=UPI001E501E10
MSETHVGGMAYINHELGQDCGMCKQAWQYDVLSEGVRPCKSLCPTNAFGFDSEDMYAMIREEKGGKGAGGR